MKISIFLLVFTLFSFKNSLNAPQYRECSNQKLSQIVHSSPALIYGTLSDCKLDDKNLWINATLTIKTVIKGNDFDKTKTMRIKYPAYINNEIAKVRKATYRNGTTYIFPMYKLDDTVWTTEINYCNYANLFKINPKTDNITFDNGEIIKMTDFAESTTVFNQNYQALLEAKTNSTPINTDSISTNSAFKWLINDFFDKNTVVKSKNKVKNTKNKKK